MQSDALQCPVCYQNYDSAERLPRILIQCGHTICTYCLVNILKSNDSKCPLDKKRSINTSGDSIEMYPINYSFKQLIEEAFNYDICPEHGSRMEIVCLTDKCKACAFCALFNGHKDHNIRQIKEMKPEFDNKQKVLEDALERLNGYYRENHVILDGEKIATQSVINNWFREQMSSLKKRKLEMLYDTDSFFNAEKEKLERSCGKNSTLRNSVKCKINKLKDFAKSCDVFSLLEEDTSLFSSKFDKKIFSDYTSELSRRLNNIAASFKTQFGAEQVSLANTGLKEQVLPDDPKTRYFGEQCESILNQPDLITPCTEITTPFYVKSCDGYLEVTRGTEMSKISILDLKKLSDIKEIRLVFDYTFIREESLKALVEMLEKASRLSSLRILLQIMASEATEEQYMSVFSNIFSKAQKLEEVEIDFHNAEIRDEVIFTTILNKAFTQLVSLKSLHLDFRSTCIRKRSFQTLSKIVLPTLNRLENLTLRLAEVGVTEDDLVDFFANLPSLKALSLDLEKTNISDKSISVFSKKVLPSMTSLDSLSLELARTNITDDSFAELFMSLPNNIKELRLGFESTLIRNNSIQTFIDTKFPTMKELKDLMISLRHTGVSRQLKQQVSNLLKKGPAELEASDLDIIEPLAPPSGGRHIDLSRVRMPSMMPRRIPIIEERRWPITVSTRQPADAVSPQDFWEPLRSRGANNISRMIINLEQYPLDIFALDPLE